MAISEIKFASFVSYITHMTGDVLNDSMVEELRRRIELLVGVGNGNLVPMFNAMLDGRKIDAIREYRAITGFGLKESKDEIERLMARLKPIDNG